ncbi:MAG: glycosyltransferase [Deltaproteobacteria bacterium]|nr:glycosyltransferase [Deltaproteobacteria bacterium]
MNASPRISVVIPCYNMGAFVGEAVESALAQGSGEVEVVVVDDGSNDGETPEAIDALARRVPIRVIRTANRGLAAARNEGVRNSTSDRIAFLDADDRFAPGALEAMDRALSAHADAAYVYGHTRTFGDRDEIWHRGEFNFFHLLYANEFEPAVMIRREALNRVGGFRAVGPVPGVEDWDLWLRLGALGLFGRRVDAVTLEYRIRPGSMVAAIKARWDETVAAIRAANADLFSPEQILDLKRLWSPGVCVVVPDAIGASAMMTVLERTYPDIEIRDRDGRRIRPNSGELPDGASSRASHVIHLESLHTRGVRSAFQRVRQSEWDWPISRTPTPDRMESAKRHAAPIWWRTRLPRDVDDLDGPIARVQLFMRRLRASGEREWSAFGAGLFAERVLSRVTHAARPVAIYDDFARERSIQGVPVLRPNASAPPSSRVLIFSDLYAREIFRRATDLWPDRADRIHALDF